MGLSLNMARGKRYQTEGKLNYTKVFAVIIAIAVVIMFIFIIKNVLKQREKVTKNYQDYTKCPLFHMLLLIYHLLKEFINNLPPRIITESLSPGLF